MGESHEVALRFRKVPLCGALVAPEVQCMTSRMRECVIRECRKAISSAKCSREYANILPLTALGLRIDKDGGYALEARTEHRKVHEEILSSNSYAFIVATSKKEEVSNAIRKYLRLCAVVEQCMYEPGLARELRKSLQNGKVVAKLKPTCKSHKPQGEVSHRPVHALPGYAFLGCSKWISLVLRRNLLSREYLLKDTVQFIRSISTMRPMADQFSCREMRATW